MAVTVIGDAFIDIVVPISGVGQGETHHRNIHTFCGGTANVATGVAKLGEEAKFVGKVGNDALGLYFKQNLLQYDVKDLTFVDDSHPTGVCVSLSYEDGERSMVASRGANDYLTKGEIKICLNELLKSKIVYLSGYSLINNPEVILSAISICRGSCEIWFNPGSPNIARDSLNKITGDFIDVIVMNLAEARAITGKGELEQVLTELQSMKALPVITSGKDGCLVRKDKQWIQVPVENVVQRADTTGAGDAFSAGFIVSRLRGMDEVESAKLGHQAAADFLASKRKVML